MTAPVGTPDWLRTFAASRQILASDQNVNIAANRVIGPLVTGNFHSVGVNILPSLNHVSVFLDWYMDAALTTLLSSDHIDVRQSIGFDQTVTCKGAFLNVTIVPRGGASSTYSLLIWDMPYEAVAAHNPTDLLIFSVNGTLVAATSTVTVNAVKQFTGPASLTLYSSDAAAWNASLLSQDASGATKVIVRADNKFPIQCGLVYLPNTPTQISFTNSDGVARFFFAFLWGKPLYP